MLKRERKMKKRELCDEMERKKARRDRSLRDLSLVILQGKAKYPIFAFENRIKSRSFTMGRVSFRCRARCECVNRECRGDGVKGGEGFFGSQRTRERGGGGGGRAKKLSFSFISLALPSLFRASNKRRTKSRRRQKALSSLPPLFS